MNSHWITHFAIVENQSILLLCVYHCLSGQNNAWTLWTGEQLQTRRHLVGWLRGSWHLLERHEVHCMALQWKVCWHIEAKTKRLNFADDIFKWILWLKIFVFWFKLSKLCFSGSNWLLVIIGSANGCAATKRRRTNVLQDTWHHMTTLGHNDLPSGWHRWHLDSQKTESCHLSRR